MGTNHGENARLPSPSRSESDLIRARISDFEFGCSFGAIALVSESNNQAGKGVGGYTTISSSIMIRILILVGVDNS